MSETRTVRLGDYCHKIEKITSKNFSDESFQYVDLSSIDNKKKIITRASKILTTEAPSRAKQILKKGDVLVSTVRPNLNAVAVVPDELDGCIGSTGFSVLRPTNELDPVYLFSWVCSPIFVNSMVNLATGASYPAISDRVVKDSLIPFPPLEEQKKIAAEFTLTRLISQKRERQQELFIEFERAIFNQKYAKATKSVKLGDIVEIRSGLVDPTLPEYQDLPHIGPDSIVSGRDEITGWRTAAKDGVKSGKFLFKKGDILYSKIRPNLNKVAIAQFDGLCSADMYPLIVNNNLVGSKYLQMALSSERFIAYASSLANRANIPKLNKKQLLSFQLKI